MSTEPATISDKSPSGLEAVFSIVTGGFEYLFLLILIALVVSATGLIKQNILWLLFIPSIVAIFISAIEWFDWI
ncbi:hypothetical protein BG842_22535 [Haladaptatus sp. W1]|nr:hypothetical protein BG842_22535 [Haladaptatus sp. W1]